MRPKCGKVNIEGCDDHKIHDSQLKQITERLCRILCTHVVFIFICWNAVKVFYNGYEFWLGSYISLMKISPYYRILYT